MTFKISELIKLGEKKAILDVNTILSIDEYVRHKERTVGYNLARDEDNNMDITVDEEVMVKILQAYRTCDKKRLVDIFPCAMKNPDCGLGEIYDLAKAIASQLPKIIRKVEK